MTRISRLGDKLELLLAESLRVAHQSGALRTRDLARVTSRRARRVPNCERPVQLAT